MSNKAYAQAGVDIALGDSVKDRLKTQLARATRPEVIGGLGGFGGLFDLSQHGLEKPVLVASTDGVGTKLKLAFTTGRHRGIGHDIVNHCINDLAVCGAQPLFFLDYFASGKLDPAVFHELLEGMAEACADAGCALLGGETAQMPGFYRDGEYDVCGTIVGIVERARILSGAPARPGDVLIGLSSSGLHTNGYSLARRIVDASGLGLDTPVPGGEGETLADALLAPHRCYGPFLGRILPEVNRGASSEARDGNGIFALSHITGGGFTGNLPRVLPEGVAAEIDTAAWQAPALFRWLVESGKVDRAEAYEVFNMGIGLVMVVAPEAVATVTAAATAEGLGPAVIGRLVEGNREVRLVAGS